MKHAVLILAVWHVVALAQADTATRWNGSADINFAGTSTLHDWSGKVSAEPFIATVIMDAAGRPKTLAAFVKVKAGDMDTAKPKRDADMHKAMLVVDHPFIAASFEEPFTGIMPDGRTPAKLPFVLSLIGKDHEITGDISKWKLTGDTATFDLDFELSLKKCRISVPSVLLVIRVGDTIKLHASVKLIRAKG